MFEKLISIFKRAKTMDDWEKAARIGIEKKIFPVSAAISSLGDVKANEMGRTQERGYQHSQNQGYGGYKQTQDYNMGYQGRSMPMAPVAPRPVREREEKEEKKRRATQSLAELLNAVELDQKNN